MPDTLIRLPNTSLFYPPATDLEREQAVEILRQAQAELVVRGRTIHVSENDLGQVCMTGAVEAAEDVFFEGVEEQPYRPVLLARNALREACNEVYDGISVGPWSRIGPVTANDAIHVIIHRGHHLVDASPETTEEILQDFDIAVWMIEAGKVDL